MTVRDYLTATEFKSWARITSEDSTDDARIEGFITVASRWVDDHTGRDDGTFFVPTSTAASLRYFDGSGRDQMWIPECLSITTLQVSNDNGTTYTTYTADDDFWTSSGEEGGYGQTPIRLLVANPNADMLTFYAGHRSVKITAVWGYSSEPPQPIKRATFELAQRLYHMADAGPEAERTLIAAEGIYLPADAIPKVCYSLLAPYVKRGL